MSTASSGDPFAPVYRLLDEIAMKHYEMAQTLGEYKDLVEKLEERGDEETLRVARSLPGARYMVSQTFVRENWLKVQAELSVLFPQDDAQA
ncbi:MAG: hypothetical protein JHC74_08540 [Thermoleophilia bacterium]|nr:hypothetical protein [Thermoleophilia bacterium]